jgi:hypothetical protein
VLKGTTYVQLLNPLGGIPPPELSPLTSYSEHIANFPLAVPYQADYVFLSHGLPYEEKSSRKGKGFQRNLHHPLTGQHN